jgi:uncharacterized protein (DUF2384 family)
MDISHASTDPATLRKAILRAAQVLDLTSELPQVLGIESSAWEALNADARGLVPGTTEWNAAARFAGLFRLLLSLVGTVPNAQQWLDQPHRTLGATPRSLLVSMEGLERVVRYLEAVQKFEVKLPPRSSQS